MSGKNRERTGGAILVIGGVVALALIFGQPVESRPFGDSPGVCDGFTRPNPHPTGEFVFYGSHEEIVELRGQVTHQGWNMGPLIVLRYSDAGPCLAQYYKTPGWNP